jgi:hypothetical protein
MLLGRSAPDAGSSRPARLVRELLGDTLLLLALVATFERAAAASPVHSPGHAACTSTLSLILGHPTFAELLPRSSHSRAAS